MQVLTETEGSSPGGKAQAKGLVGLFVYSNVFVTNICNVMHTFGSM